jgi:hypothetical protein
LLPCDDATALPSPLDRVTDGAQKASILNDAAGILDGRTAGAWKLQIFRLTLSHYV